MKSRFTSKFLLERGIGIDTWELWEALSYFSERLGGTITAPKLFSTDFASIPRLFHRLLPKNGIYDPAAVIHDFLYSLCGRVKILLANGVTIERKLSRKECDLVFLEAMEALKVPGWKESAMYRAVRIGGNKAWKKHAKNLWKKTAQEIAFAAMIALCCTGCMSSKLAEALKDSNSSFAADVNTVYGRVSIRRANPQPGQTATIHPDGRIEVRACE